MAKFELEGDFADVSTRQLEYITGFLEKRGYNGGKVVIKPVGEAGDNFVANVKRITIEKDGESFKIVAKFAPTAELLRQMMNTAIVFHNEHVMYTEVLPKFKQLQKAAEFPETEMLRFAECYGSFTEEPNEVILLEDLRVSGFKMLDRYKSLPDDAVRLLLKNFAILHSLSYVLKYKEPETYKAFQTKLINTWQIMCDVPQTNVFFKKIEEDTLMLLGDDDRKKYIKGMGDQIVTATKKLAKFDNQSKYSVILQGDSWTNNLMFVSEKGKVVDCCMIDYQISREGNPVNDIHYMIFNCTDYEARSAHYHNWIDFYHSELDNVLANFGLKANFVYPRDRLDADLRRHGKITLSSSVILAGVLIRQKEDAAAFKVKIEQFTDINTTEEFLNSAKVSALDDESIQRFKTRIEGIIDSLIECGCL